MWTESMPSLPVEHSRALQFGFPLTWCQRWLRHAGRGYQCAGSLSLLRWLSASARGVDLSVYGCKPGQGSPNRKLSGVGFLAFQGCGQAKWGLFLGSRRLSAPRLHASLAPAQYLWSRGVHSVCSEAVCHLLRGGGAGPRSNAAEVGEVRSTLARSGRR